MAAHPGPGKYQERVPAQPFVAWVNEQLARIGDDSAQLILASRLGVSEKTVYRWRSSLDGGSPTIPPAPTDEYARKTVEDALDHADVPFADLYPEIAAAEDVELEPDAYCESCHEVVTPIGGACPWCERPTRMELPTRMYCKREDSPSFAALDGNCWRCGGPLRKHMPTRKCACGCEVVIARFDPRGREISYVVGHAPRSLERDPLVDIEPFAEWLEAELRTLDPIQSLARRVGLSREDVLTVLNRRDLTIQAQKVRRSLWLAGREGQGKGMPSRPGWVKLSMLYPNDVRSSVCPQCGGRKSAYAQRCRGCAVNAGVYVTRNARHPSSLTSDQVEEARMLRERDGLSFIELARLLQPRTRMTNVESVKNELQRQFRKRGWPTSRVDRRLAA